MARTNRRPRFPAMLGLSSCENPIVVDCPFALMMSSSRTLTLGGAVDANDVGVLPPYVSNNVTDRRDIGDDQSINMGNHDWKFGGSFLAQRVLNGSK